MCLDSEGSSPSQMIATWLARLARWRSMQLYETLVSPSSNHLIQTSPGPRFVFLILLGVLNQCRRLASCAQKPFGSLIERAYISRYFAASTCARLAQSCATSWILSDIAPSGYAGGHAACPRLVSSCGYYALVPRGATRRGSVTL